ncbi:nuclear transport factor 2 family protein [Phenylobacterium sp.]|jgi:ketosteroid isomerase-like protein|uniref:nuclear transport factor 2 family protein n=1 Tax=Phenylobacterium sp. TaxID=1871053 RepID=UPI002F943EB5
MSRATIVRAYLKAIELRKDVLGFYADDIVQEEFPNLLAPAGATRTLADLKAANARGQDVLRSESYEIVSLVEQAEVIACEIVWKGVLAIPLRTLKPGDTMQARFAVFFEFDGDKIRRQRNYDCFEPF